MGVALAPVVEAASLADSGTTWTPSIIEGAECAPETSPVEEGTDVGEPEDTTAEAEVFGPAEGMADAETEPELETGTCVIGEAVVITEVDGTVATEVLLVSAPVAVAVAGTGVSLAPASPGVSITTGSLATNTRATFWAPEMLPLDESEGAAPEDSAARTAKSLIKA